MCKIGLDVSLVIPFGEYQKAFVWALRGERAKTFVCLAMIVLFVDPFGGKSTVRAVRGKKVRQLFASGW